MIHSMNIDDTGHKYGSESKEYRYNVRTADNLLSVFVPRWVEAGYTIIVTSDHGMSPDGMHGGKNELESEIPFWIINDKENIKLSHKMEQVYVASIIGYLLGNRYKRYEKQSRKYLQGVLKMKRKTKKK